MSFANAASWQVFTTAGHRKYITASEHAGFLAHADRLAPERRAFCYVVAYTGCRVSEALTLTRPQIILDTCSIIVRTLKRRREVFRVIPIPPVVRDMLLALPVRDDGRVWPFRGRSTAWRIITGAMIMAGIDGPQACPRGLRHGFGMRAAGEAIPPGIIQRWMGHANLETTQIYLDAQGDEERGFAARMFAGSQLSQSDPLFHSTASMTGIVRRPDRQSTPLASAPQDGVCAAPRPTGGLTGFDSRSAGPSSVSPHQAVKWFAAQKRRKTMTEGNTTKGSKPTHRIYIVTGEGDKAIWRELGAAWPNKDGKGFNIECTAIPLAGHLVMREIKTKTDDRQGALV